MALKHELVIGANRHISRIESLTITRLVNALYPDLVQMTMTSSTEPYQCQLDIESKIQEQSTFYCLFMPLGIYCAFGASNIYHAYNKALKQWGARVYLDQINTAYHKGDAERLYRISVYSNTSFIHEALKEVKQTTMTKLVKAWREDN